MDTTLEYLFFIPLVLILAVVVIALLEQETHYD